MSSGQGYNTGDRQATVTSGSTTRYTIPSLTNGTEYTVRVIATRTGADDGPPVGRDDGRPAPPPVTATSSRATQLVVTDQRGLHGAVDSEGYNTGDPAGHGVDHGYTASPTARNTRCG